MQNCTDFKEKTQYFGLHAKQRTPSPLPTLPHCLLASPAPREARTVESLTLTLEKKSPVISEAGNPLRSREPQTFPALVGVSPRAQANNLVQGHAPSNRCRMGWPRTSGRQLE